MIRLDKDGALWTATLDRPDKANALTEAMLSELADIAEAAALEAQVFILTGAGKVFSAGADLEAARAGLATSPVWERLSTAIAACPASASPRSTARWRAARWAWCWPATSASPRRGPRRSTR